MVILVALKKSVSLVKKHPIIILPSLISYLLIAFITMNYLGGFSLTALLDDFEQVLVLLKWWFFSWLTLMLSSVFTFTIARCYIKKSFKGFFRRLIVFGYKYFVSKIIIYLSLIIPYFILILLGVVLLLLFDNIVFVYLILVIYSLVVFYIVSRLFFVSASIFLDNKSVFKSFNNSLSYSSRNIRLVFVIVLFTAVFSAFKFISGSVFELVNFKIIIILFIVLSAIISAIDHCYTLLVYGEFKKTI